MKSQFKYIKLPIDKLPSETLNSLKRDGLRFGHMTARPSGNGAITIEVLLLNTKEGRGEILYAPLPEGTDFYPSVTALVPSAHRAERAIGDFFGLKAVKHPLWKSLILHDNVWPLKFNPLNLLGDIPLTDNANPHYEFMEVKGEGVHEIPVGPIHAGIIEPGHFRFSCIGEIITNLEIRLGYQHRGIEYMLANIPWQKARFIAESASSDTSVGNALAHAVAIEQLLGFEAFPRANFLRTISLEIERLANHLGDLGGLSADIGYSAGASIFARLRGTALGLGELLTGSRFQKWYVLPGGVSRDLKDAEISSFVKALAKLSDDVKNYLPLVTEHPSVIERMEGTGRLSKSLAMEFSIVGPAGRASGIRYDSRSCFEHGVFPAKAPVTALREDGDVLARTLIRQDEILSSFSLISELVESLPNSPIYKELNSHLPSDSPGIGIVESWRGELIHWITTDSNGNISRYAIKDPSFNNWTGLAIAVRGNLVSDFPLCNKSFNLSYSGNDL